MRIRASGDLNQLVNDMRRCGALRISHAKIDDVLAARARLRFQLVDDVEYVRRQALDTREICFHDVSSDADAATGCRAVSSKQLSDTVADAVLSTCRKAPSMALRNTPRGKPRKVRVRAGKTPFIEGWRERARG